MQYKYPFKLKHVSVLKSSGLGITEFVLRFIAGLCLKDEPLQGSHDYIYRSMSWVGCITYRSSKDLFMPHPYNVTDIINRYRPHTNVGVCAIGLVVIPVVRQPKPTEKQTR